MRGGLVTDWGAGWKGRRLLLTGSNTPADAMYTSGTSPHFSSATSTSLSRSARFVTSHLWNTRSFPSWLFTNASACSLSFRSATITLEPIEAASLTISKPIPALVVSHRARYTGVDPQLQFPSPVPKPKMPSPFFLQNKLANR